MYVRKAPLPHPYPWRRVLIACAVLSVETLIFYALIRPESYNRSWGRALSAAVAGVALLFFFALGLMHSPPYVFSHWVWLSMSTLAFLTLSVVSAIASARSHAA